MLLAVLCDGWWLCRLYTDVLLYFLASAASFLYCDACLQFRGCPVVLGIEHFVSARYQKSMGRELRDTNACRSNFAVVGHEESSLSAILIGPKSLFVFALVACNFEIFCRTPPRAQPYTHYVQLFQGTH